MKTFAILVCALCLGCGDDGVDADDQEFITTVILTFTPAGGGAAVVAEFDDPDGDGGDAPTVDPIDLAAGDYTLDVGFENRLEDPAEVITEEIADEDDEHQVFLTGTAVDGPASVQAGAPLAHSYADADGEGNPIGLANTIIAAAGSGTLTVTLRHLPPVDGTAVKISGLAEMVASGGLGAIPGESDVSVSFDVTVQ
jgi:hypothetical protein